MLILKTFPLCFSLVHSLYRAKIGLRVWCKYFEHRFSFSDTIAENPQNPILVTWALDSFKGLVY